jgi:hypothetical protein
MDIFNNMDEDTAALILQLQLEDSLELSAISEGEGKGSEGEVTDTQYALGLYKEGLQRNTSIINDLKLSKSIAQDCNTDGQVFTPGLLEERRTASDHETSGRLGGVATNTASPAGIVNAEQMDDQSLAKLSAPYVSTPVDDSKVLIEVRNFGASISPVDSS